ncbi:5-AMP-activated protein kinase, catalytic [Irineochytrium annulatum]|nr:5-AMP-activated protein kinase, catalytic [Irineochytrium annulatum]
MAQMQIKIGNYTLLETLGVGSFGKVKLAVHSHTGLKVAMKIANLDMVSRLKREILYLKKLRHPHIIKLYEVISTPTDIILVMEYAGGELFNYIVERGRMTEDDSRRFFQQIICAVEYCHKHKIVHRDLKPENVLLDELNQVKLGDFGLSNIMSDGDFLKTSCGSPNYAAPEVISGRQYEGPEIDVWSCGVILYVMLCGRLPFDDDYIPNLFKKINGGIFTLPNFLSPATKSMLSSMLIVDPLKRITIPEIRQKEWFNVGLPAYLHPQYVIPDPLVVHDDLVVAEICKKMGFMPETVAVALADKENNQIKVAYQLILDNRRLLGDSKMGGYKGIQPFLTGSSPPKKASSATLADKDKPMPGSGSSVKENDENIPPSTIQVFRPTAWYQDAPPQPPPKQKKTRARWHFGIRSRSPPFDIMLEIYRALKNIGMEWKPVDAFHIKCRHVTSAHQVVKLDIQLYKVESNNYLVDFKNATTPTIARNLAGEEEPPLEEGAIAPKVNLSAFAFFDACSKLITELAISA